MKKFFKYLIITISVLILVGGIAIALIFNAFVSDMQELFSSDTQKVVYPSDKVSADIELNERRDFFSIKSKVFNHKLEYIEDNASIMLNGAKMAYARIPNGYYGHWVYHYIDATDEPDIFKNSKEFIFSLARGDNIIHLASINTLPSVDKSDIKYIKKEDSLEIIWKDLVGLDKLTVTVDAKINNENIVGHTVDSIGIKKSGEYLLRFKDLDHSISKINAISFSFVGKNAYTVDDNLIKDSKLTYLRQYYEHIDYRK